MPDVTVKLPAIEKLIDYGASGIGAIAGPLLAPWKASREGKARLIAAEVDARAREIQAHADASALSIIAEAQTEARAYLPSDSNVRATLDITREDIAQSFEFQGRKRLTNVRSVLEGAAEELGNKEVPDHEPDHDWTARFFNEVQDVSSEDMQKIWARILAGEVESPGRTSLRTLDILRNMTKKDAEMFRNICDFVINHNFVFYDDSVKSMEAFNYSNLLHLQDCRLVTIVSNLASKFAWGGPPHIRLIHHDGFLHLSKEQISETAERGLEIPVFVLTTAGQELFHLVQGTVNMQYLQYFAKFLKSEGFNLAYEGKVEPLAGDSGDFATITLIEPESRPIEEPAP